MNGASAITNYVVETSSSRQGEGVSLNQASATLNGSHKPPLVQVFGDVASDMGVRHSERLMFGTVNRVKMPGFVETFNVYEGHPRVIVMVRVRPVSRVMACMPLKFYHDAGYGWFPDSCLSSQMVIIHDDTRVYLFLADSRLVPALTKLVKRQRPRH